MSSSVCLLPLIAALWTGSKLPDLQSNPWQATNSQQEYFLANHYDVGVQALTSNLLRPEELICKASNNVVEVNEFLVKNDFTLQLQDEGPNSIYLASILNVLVEWTKKGNEITLIGASDKQKYPGVSLGKSHFRAVNTDNHERSVFMVKTKSGDIVYMTCAHKQDTSKENRVALTGFDLVSHVMNVSTMIDEKGEFFEDLSILKFPMIDYNETANVGWLVGMASGDWFITQALQQTMFKMDEFGAEVKSAFAGSVSRCLPEEYVINEPFYLWIKRPGISFPIFAAYFDESSWKNPKIL